MFNYYLFKLLVQFYNYGTPSGNRLYEEALKSLGKDISPNDKAPDRLACVESVEEVHKNAFGEYIGGGLSTIREKTALDNSIKFIRVTKPLKGDIILSVTGEGNGKVSNGHIGIIGDKTVMSNNSNNGLFEEVYTIQSWKDRWETLGGYPVYYYRKLIG